MYRNAKSMSSVLLLLGRLTSLLYSDKRKYALWLIWNLTMSIPNRLKNTLETINTCIKNYFNNISILGKTANSRTLVRKLVRQIAKAIKNLFIYLKDHGHWFLFGSDATVSQRANKLQMDGRCLRCSWMNWTYHTFEIYKII